MTLKIVIYSTRVPGITRRKYQYEVQNSKGEVLISRPEEYFSSIKGATLACEWITDKKDVVFGYVDCINLLYPADGYNVTATLGVFIVFFSGMMVGGFHSSYRTGRFVTGAISGSALSLAALLAITLTLSAMKRLLS